MQLLQRPFTINQLCNKKITGDYLPLILIISQRFPTVGLLTDYIIVIKGPHDTKLWWHPNKFPRGEYGSALRAVSISSIEIL